MQLVRCATAAFLIFCATAVAAGGPALLLAETDRGEVNVSRYLVSEKYDGVRAYWDGAQLISRGGNVVRAPDWFVAVLPAHPLDGELWLGRGRFAEMSGLARREVADDESWRQVSYLLFELPDGAGTFAERATRLRELAGRMNVHWVRAVEQFRLSDRDALQRRLDEVVGAGGEGLMLHRADAPYRTGRDPVLLKVKAWQDAEATVVAHLPGKGALAGAMGALRVRTAEGREFALGTGFSDDERRHPPPVGSTVTYRYRELTSGGLPRHASYWRRRRVE